jgi:L-threonylcarbamoyladenylate synthase
MGWE